VDKNGKLFKYQKNFSFSPYYLLYVMLSLASLALQDKVDTVAASRQFRRFVNTAVSDWAWSWRVAVWPAG